MVWVAGGALAAVLLGAFVLLSVVLVNGLGYFWPAPLEELRLLDGRVFLGRRIGQTGAVAAAAATSPSAPPTRVLMLPRRPSNGSRNADVASSTFPPGAWVVERSENSDFYGTLADLRLPELDVPPAADPAGRLQAALRAIQQRRARGTRSDRGRNRRR